MVPGPTPAEPELMVRWLAAVEAVHAHPAWVFLTGLKSSLSSTELRNQDGSWKK